VPPAGFSSATVLDQVRAGATLQSIADAHSMDEIVAAVRDALIGLRLGVSSLDEAGLHRVAGLELWSIAEIAGHALRMDEAAHAVARALAIGQSPAIDIPYGAPGPASATRDDLLGGVTAAEERLATARVLAAGGPTLAHQELGELTARGWILASGLHLASHLHQAAAVVRAR
jgi:hypothetical protein